MNLKRELGSSARSAGKFFRWLFQGKSMASHIAFLVFAYFSLKYMLFPGFLFLTGMNDVVAVLSGSMHHQPGVIDNTFTGWLVFNGYNETNYTTWPFQHGLDVGDAVTVIPGLINVGDVIVYYHQGQMIIHRVVDIKVIDGIRYYTTKGDANPGSMVFETMIHESRVVGKAASRVPWIGWPRTMMYYLIGF